MQQKTAIEISYLKKLHAQELKKADEKKKKELQSFKKEVEDLKKERDWLVEAHR